MPTISHVIPDKLSSVVAHNNEDIYVGASDEGCIYMCPSNMQVNYIMITICLVRVNKDETDHASWCI